MADDPRPNHLEGVILYARAEQSRQYPALRIAHNAIPGLDELDPLRQAIKHPSPELIERLRRRANRLEWLTAEEIRVLLAALAEETRTDG